MPESDFRKVRSLDLPPTYTSLGLKPGDFASGQAADGVKGFSAVLNGPGDILWLFKGSDYYTFNLRTRVMESGPLPLANWTMRSGQRLPLAFQAGIDAAVWAGEAFPKLYYFYKGTDYVRLNATGLPDDGQGLGEPFEHFLACDVQDTIPGTWGVKRDVGGFVLSSPSGSQNRSYLRAGRCSKSKSIHPSRRTSSGNVC